MRRVVPLFAFALCLIALPLLAASADQAPAATDHPGCVNMTPIESYTMDDQPVEWTDSLSTPDPSEQGAGCTGWADCYGGGRVTCSGTWSCWGISECYAYCDGNYVWCSYRPHPCPV